MEESRKFPTSPTASNWSSETFLKWSKGLALTVRFSGKLKVFVLAATLAFQACSPPGTQNTAERRTSSADAKPENELREQEARVLMQRKLRREHSDASGRLRPDLFAKAIAQIQRMKVAKQIGPDSAASLDKK